MASGLDNIKSYLQLLNRRKELFLGLALTIMTVVIIVSYLLPKKYEAKSTVFIEKNVISELVKGITVTPSMEDTIRVLTYAITSRSLLTKVVDNLDMNMSGNRTIDTQTLVKNLQLNIDVKVKDKDLFIISFRDRNPRLARDFVNTLVRMYIEENSSSKRGESYDATNFLSEQIDTVKTKLEQAEAEVNAYKREQGGIIAINEGKLFEEINVAQQKLYDLELRRRQLEGTRHITKLNSDPLLVKLNDLQKKLESLRTEYTESYPEVIKVKGEIETIKGQMKGGKGGTNLSLDTQELTKVDSEIAAIKATEEGLRRHIATNQDLLRRIPSAKAGLEKLELAKNNQKNLYDQLFARHGVAEVSKQMEVQDKGMTFRVVDPAILPSKPISPNRLKIMMMGILGGIAGSFGLLLLLDQKDDTVKGLEFARSFGMPVLAVIPHVQDQQSIEVVRRREVRLYACAGSYFLFILCFPLMEMLGLKFMDKLVDSVSLTGLLQGIKSYLR